MRVGRRLAAAVFICNFGLLVYINLFVGHDVYDVPKFCTDLRCVASVTPYKKFYIMSVGTGVLDRPFVIINCGPSGRPVPTKKMSF